MYQLRCQRPGCTKTFETTRPERKYCSGTCKTSVAHKKQREAYRRMKAELEAKND